MEAENLKMSEQPSAALWVCRKRKEFRLFGKVEATSNRFGLGSYYRLNPKSANRCIDRNISTSSEFTAVEAT